MALSPETLKRRKRTMLPRAPHKRLGEEAAEPKSADEKLEALLEELLAEAKKETLFTMTLEKHRLMSALRYAGFVGVLFYNFEAQIAPLGTVTTYMPVTPGWVYCPDYGDYYNSLPWWISGSVWVDTDFPALPWVTLTRFPDHWRFEFRGIAGMFHFMRFTMTNNHVANTANVLALQSFAIMPRAVWNMLEEIYLKPIVVYAQEKAEELTGRPYP